MFTFHQLLRVANSRLLHVHACALATAMATALVMALASPVAHAAETAAAGANPAIERGGPVLPANAVLLKVASSRRDADVLRVGVSEAGYPPLEIITTGGQVAGITADYASLIGKHLKKRVEVVMAPNFVEVLELLKKGEIDMVGSIARTASRDSYAAFSTPFLTSTPVVIQRRDAEKRDATKLGTVIAVETGSAVVEFIKRDFPSAKMVELASPLAALQLVARGQADSYVGDIVTAAYLIETRYLSSLRVTSGAGFSTGELRFAVAKTQPALLRSVDLALAGVSDAEHENIRRRWLPFNTLASVQSARIDLTAQEQAWLKAHPEIRLGAEPSYQPFSMVGDNGKFEGLAADYLQLIADRTGMNVKLQPGLSWTNILDGLKNRSVDITPAVVNTSERRAYMLFAGPIVALPSVFVTPVSSKLYFDGFASLSGLRMALVKNGPITLRVEKEFPGIVPVIVDSTVDALAKVASGEADIALSNINFITREIESKYLGTLKIAGTLADSPTELNIGVRSDWPELQSIIRKGINTISRSEHEAIRQKWLSVKINQGLGWDDVLKFAVPLLLALLSVIAAVVFSKRRLQREYAKTKAVENQLAYQLALQSSLLDSLPTPVFVVDPKARFTDCNRAFESVFGVKRSQIRGSTMLDLAGSRVPEFLRLHSDLQSIVASGGSNTSDYLLPMPDGRNVHFHGAARAFTLPNGEAGGLVATASDLSDERARQQELSDARDKAESATKAKSAFLATMSHEIRTPMNGVLGMLELLAHTPLNAEQQTSIAVAQESGRTLLTLLSDVLDLSKIEANKLTLETAPASLQALAELVVQTLASGARSKGLKVRLFVAPNVASEHVFDTLRMRQILFNLLGNAIKFTRQGWVSLRITVPDVATVAAIDVATDDGAAHGAPMQSPRQRLVFEVSDSGIGIAADSQDRIFAPFEQAEPSVSQEFGGTGLGLAICRRLADLMGATLSIDSRLGAGTTVQLEADFPVANADLAAASQKTVGTHIKVLILTDDLNDQETLSAYLAARQFEPLVPFLLPANAPQLQRLVVAQKPQCAMVLPAMLAQMGVAPTALASLLSTEANLSGAVLVEPAVVLLTESGQIRQESARHLSNQPLLPTAVVSLLEEWRGHGQALPPPLALTSSASPARATASLAPRILVAEDHPINQTIVCKQLEMIGYRVTLCGDGEAALNAWRTGWQDPANQFSALLVDCHMPLMDGYALARRIRSIEADAALVNSTAAVARVPIIALTADSASNVWLQCAAAGMDDLLIKPADIPTLRATLSRRVLGSGLLASPATSQTVSLPPMPAGMQNTVLSATFDLDRLVVEMGGSDAVMGLMKDYVRSTQEDIARLASVASDAAQTRHIAHRIKGAARLVGARRIEDISASLESFHAESLTADTVHQACDAMRDALDSIAQALAHPLLPVPPS